MMIHELKVETNLENPWTSGFVTFFSFVTLGIIPIIPYVVGTFLIVGYIFSINNDNQILFKLSIAMTGLTLCLLGYIKSLFTL